MRSRSHASGAGSRDARAPNTGPDRLGVVLEPFGAECGADVDVDLTEALLAGVRERVRRLPAYHFASEFNWVQPRDHAELAWYYR